MANSKLATFYIKEAATIVYFSKSAKTLMQATMVITFAKIGNGNMSD